VRVEMQSSWTAIEKQVDGPDPNSHLKSNQSLYMCGIESSTKLCCEQ